MASRIIFDHPLELTVFTIVRALIRLSELRITLGVSILSLGWASKYKKFKQIYFPFRPAEKFDNDKDIIVELGKSKHDGACDPIPPRYLNVSHGKISFYPPTQRISSADLQEKDSVCIFLHFSSTI